MCERLLNRTRPPEEFARPVQTISWKEWAETKEKPWVYIPAGKLVRALVNCMFRISKGFGLQ
jgi:hypothetical protein